MSRVIYKFPLEVRDEQIIEVPGGITPLHVGFQDGTLCLWGSVWPGYSTVPFPVYIIGTGNPYNIEDPMLIHAGTAYDGLFVWHVFVGSQLDSAS